MELSTAAKEAEGISLQLLVDNQSNRVLYAETGKAFVDLLFGFLQIPLGSIVGILQENHMNVSGSFGRLFGSVKELEPTYFQSQTVTESLLKPEVASASLAHPLLQNFATPKQLKSETITTPSFSYAFVQAPSSSNRAEAGKEMIGLVKEGETKFIVMDDLRVFPLSSIFLVDLFNKFNVNDISFWEVKINLKKCLELVKASMKSGAVLTDVFIGNKSP
ncbi:hypothetical protein GH714_012517 [Hevea brasiliensis]|uniref:DUF674 family protein n=1 Tax=Hevea brasiliensis TaxID=3981 RepID=A0A6A6LL70_HEVBR|nr:hypothetical protein GH714_012488 [Hevea brasiliensis]KAF2300369.1 hypothetical protein GH714_012517 [Hevea brasiliensis]